MLLNWDCDEVEGTDVDVDEDEDEECGGRCGCEVAGSDPGGFGDSSCRSMGAAT